MNSEKGECERRVSQWIWCGALAKWLWRAGVVICLGSVSALAQRGNLVFDDPTFTEGDRGSIEHEIEITLEEVSSQPVRVDFVTRPGSASEDEDYAAHRGTLVFVPGSLEPGLPRPEEAEDPLMRALVLEEGFGIDVLADIDDPVGLAFPPVGSAFGEFLYVGSLDQNGIGVRDAIGRIDFLGEIEDFVFLLPEADPTSLESLASHRQS